VFRQPDTEKKANGVEEDRDYSFLDKIGDWG
jgi:hypothetical protein